MNAFREQLSRGCTFQEVRDLHDVVPKTSNHEMDMVWHDGARQDCVSRLRDHRREAAGDGAGLPAGELDEGILEGIPRCFAPGDVTGVVRGGSTNVSLGRRSKVFVQLVGADEVRPGAAFFVWEPEAVATDDDVSREDHTATSFSG